MDNLVLIFLLISFLVKLNCKEIRMRYPSTIIQLFDTSLPRGLRPQNRISLRQNVFGPSKIIEGSAYVPEEMSYFTGKLGTHKIEKFKWKPENNFLTFMKSNNKWI